MKLFGILSIVGLLAVPGIVNAAPLVAVPGAPSQVASSLIEKTHGDHRSCEEGRGSWHRHNRYGERVDCEPRHYGRPQHHPGYAPPPPPYVNRLPPPPPGYHHRPAPPRNCVKDWHCEKSGPFDLKKRCYWRDLCN